MAKYIDAEHLKAELEKQADIEFKKTEENASSPVLCHFHNGCMMQALDTIDFINSFQQEKPEADLKREIEKGWEEFEKDYSPSALDKSYMIVSGLVGEKQFSRIARHFYELGLNARKEK